PCVALPVLTDHLVDERRFPATRWAGDADEVRLPGMGEEAFEGLLADVVVVLETSQQPGERVTVAVEDAGGETGRRHCVRERPRARWRAPGCRRRRPAAVCRARRFLRYRAIRARECLRRGWCRRPRRGRRRGRPP